MARKLKCQWCKVTDSIKAEMQVEHVGKQNKYYHKKCHAELLKDKVFKEQERAELDKLVKVIKDIYGVKVVPNSAYPYLQDLRNGTKFFGRYDYNYKKGYTYAVIAEAYDYCSETIDYYNRTKTFNGFMSAFRYGLAIVCDKLSIVQRRQKDREMRERLTEEHIEGIEGSEYQFQTSYRKPNRTDISEFLDD